MRVECIVEGGPAPTIYRARELVGDHLWTTLKWEDPLAVASLAGRNVPLPFKLYNAKVFGFRM